MAAITLPGDIAMYTGSSFAAVVGVAAITNPIACVTFSTVNPLEIIITSAANQFACGFIYEPGASASNPIAIGDKVTVYTSGHVWAMASAALATVLATVGSAAGGKIAAATAVNAYVGRTFAVAAADTEWVPILITLGSSV